MLFPGRILPGSWAEAPSQEALTAQIVGDGVEATAPRPLRTHVYPQPIPGRESFKTPPAHY